jgi:hypothetical protein
MGRWKKYLKPLVFLPAIALVGGFLAHRAGVLETHSKPAPEPASTQQASVPQTTLENNPTPAEPGLLPPGIVPRVLPHDPPPRTQPPETRTGQFVLGGSPKSDIVFRPSDLPTRDEAPSNSPPPAPQR